MSFSRPIPWYHTVRKMDLILRSIKRRPQMQFSMARRFKLQLLRRYSVKFSKMRNFTLGTPWLGKLKNTGRRRTTILRICNVKKYKHFSPYLPDCVKFCSNEYKVAENSLSPMLIKLFIDRVQWFFRPFYATQHKIKCYLDHAIVAKISASAFLTVHSHADPIWPDGTFKYGKNIYINSKYLHSHHTLILCGAVVESWVIVPEDVGSRPACF